MFQVFGLLVFPSAGEMLVGGPSFLLQPAVQHLDHLEVLVGLDKVEDGGPPTVKLFPSWVSHQNILRS